jgi:hypothetical protein
MIDFPLEFEVGIIPRKHKCSIIQTRALSCKPFYPVRVKEVYSFCELSPLISKQKRGILQNDSGKKDILERLAVAAFHLTADGR